MSARSLKPGWKMVTFGDVVENVVARANPADVRTDIYVGLEHLEPGTLHLRRWGHPSDVTGEKLFFKKGDVIFGRRRAYQRKLAVADCDGICSAHAMVVRAKPDMILPEFLPFFLQSDMFMERAIEISVGSLSPTINWKTMRIQEFSLPPLDEQKRIAEILWAADEAVEAWKRVYRMMETSLQKTRCSLFRELSLHEDTVSIKKVGLWVSGKTPSRGHNEFWSGDFPWVSPKDMKSDVINGTEEKITDVALNNGLPVLPPGSILLVVRGMILAHTFPVALAGREVAFNQDVKGIIPSPDFSSEFIFHWFKANSVKIIHSTEESTHGTKRLATDVLYKMKIPKPSLEKQKQAAGILEAFRAKFAEVSLHLLTSQKVLSSLINSQIGGRQCLTKKTPSSS